MYIHAVLPLPLPPQALQQSTWMSETITRLEGDRLTIDTLKTMVKLGSNLSRGSASVEATLARVRGLLATALDWDHKAKEALKQKWVLGVLHL